MLYLRGFCIATDPDNNVEIFCEAFRVASEWRKGFNIINLCMKSVIVPVTFSE